VPKQPVAPRFRVSVDFWVRANDEVDATTVVDAAVSALVSSGGDIEDYTVQETVPVQTQEGAGRMKLYDVPRRSYVRLLEDGQAPPAAPVLSDGQVVFFDHLDGMYSYCIDASGQVVHLAAWTEVEVLSELS
jgi:hypothetical protein